MWIDREVKAIKPKKQRFRVSEPVKRRGSGRLVLDVQPNGVKTFFFQYYRKEEGKSKRILINIGPYKGTAASSGITLEDARHKSNEYTAMMKNDGDPKLILEERERARQEKLRQAEAAKRQGTLEQLIESYLAAMEADGKRSHASVRQSLKTYLNTPFPEMLKRKANTIEADDIRIVLTKMLDKGITTHTNRVRSYLSAAFNHGLKQDNNPRSYSADSVKFNLKYNPVSFVPKQDDYERVGEHVIAEKEIKQIWEELPAESPLAAWSVKLAFTTGQRLSEIIKVRWSDIDFEEHLLIIPASVSKNKIDHVVPLDALSWTVIEQMNTATGEFDYLFPASHKGKMKTDMHVYSSTISKVIRQYSTESKDVVKFVARDIRRTVKTFMGKAGIDKAIRDRVQNHAVKDVSSKHYDRYDYLAEKREALKIWNDYLELIINPDVKVTYLSKGRN